MVAATRSSWGTGKRPWTGARARGARCLCGGVVGLAAAASLVAKTSFIGARPLVFPHDVREPQRCSKVFRLAASAEAAAEARERFLTVLAEKDGNWRDEAVMKEIELLEQANPTEDAAYTGRYLDADWLQVTAPDYNYGGTEGSTEYTLGQLSFNMYDPADLKCEVDKTTQIVAPMEDGDDSRRWDIKLHLTCVDDRYPPFKAEITTFGEITPGEDKEGNKRRLGVVFTKGELKPASGTDEETLNKWKEVFGTAYKNKKRTIGSMIKNGLLRLMMGLRPPTGVEEDGTVSFEMKKPPKGYTDILYIDDKLRVTKGNRGSIIAVTRDVVAPSA